MLEAADKVMAQKARKHLEKDGAQVDNEVIADNNDASKLSTGMGPGDTLSTDDNITTVNDTILPTDSDGTMAQDAPVTIATSQCYIASEHSYAAKPTQGNLTLGACDNV